MEESGMGASVTTIAVRILRVAVPVVLLVLVGSLVVGYWGDYRDARSSAAEGASTEETSQDLISEEETASAEPTGVPEVEPTDGSATTAQTVVVLIEGLNMRTAATTDSEVIKRLSLDQRLELIGESAGWYNVRDEAGDEGWVAAGGSYTRLE